MSIHKLQNDYAIRIDRAIAYIEANLGGKISLERVAQVAAFSPFHFHRIFSALVGETPDDYVSRLRLERAANYLIKHRERSVTEIALLCGYTSPAAFARAFKKRFGIPASRFRDEQTEAFLSSLGAGGQNGAVTIPTGAAEAFVQAVRIQDLPRRKVAYIASRSGYDLKAICAAWERLYRWAELHHLLDAETRMIGVSYDDPFITQTEHCRYYACLTVSDKPVKSGPVGYLELAEGRYAVCRVECRAEEIAGVYHSLYGLWLPESGLQPADAPTYEVYLQTPDEHPEGKYVMEVCLPVEE